jgi:WXG100 family type VII secretion target
MSGDLRVEDSALGRAADYVLGVNGSLQGKLREIDLLVRQTRDTWQGQAATTFEVVHQQWDADAKRLNDVLVKIAEELKAAGSTYEVSEEDNKAALSRIASTKISNALNP